MSFAIFSQNTSMGQLNQGQGHDCSAFDEEYLNSKRGFLARIPVNIHVSRSAAPNLALVPVIRYYCDVN